ncbi:unnamed protein product [Prorocentrum cordatum]|uniref:Uncharacterized protein n=1 Tax=Prorocentrum cordatum TaxID=2364126 RepID=A0ABN9Q7F9_9DINO|nr:unnamed protein product [Polarella glacialis]
MGADDGANVERCKQHAIVSGADTFAFDGSDCYFSKCGAAADMKWTDAYGGQEVYSVLVGDWAHVVSAEEGHSSACTYLAWLGADDGASVEKCKQHAVVFGADTFAFDGADCYFSRCGAFADMKWTNAYGGQDVYTFLFPRGDSVWPPCDPSSQCFDMTLLLTASMNGRLAAVDDTGNACDPDDDASCYGGTARRITYVEQQRERLNATQGVYVFDLGGSWFGGPFLYHPDYPFAAPNLELQDMVPYDGCLFSMYDMQLGATSDSAESLRSLAEGLARRRCPLLLANAEFGGALEPLNAKKVPWLVRTTPTGQKVGFVGFYPHSPNYWFSLDQALLKLDPEGAQARLLAGDVPQEDYWLGDERYRSRDLYRVNATLLAAAFGAAGGDFEQLEDHEASLYIAYSTVPTDVLLAAEALRRAHPDVACLVLLGGVGIRAETLAWLLDYGPFDAVVAASRRDNVGLTEHFSGPLQRNASSCAATPGLASRS